MGEIGDANTAESKTNNPTKTDNVKHFVTTAEKNDGSKTDNRVIVDKLFGLFSPFFATKIENWVVQWAHVNGENDSNICYLFCNLLKMQPSVEPEMKSKPTIKQVNERVLKKGKIFINGL